MQRQQMQQPFNSLCRLSRGESSELRHHGEVLNAGKVVVEDTVPPGARIPCRRL